MSGWTSQASADSSANGLSASRLEAQVLRFKPFMTTISCRLRRRMRVACWQPGTYLSTISSPVAGMPALRRTCTKQSFSRLVRHACCTHLGSIFSQFEAKLMKACRHPSGLPAATSGFHGYMFEPAGGSQLRESCPLSQRKPARRCASRRYHAEDRLRLSGGPQRCCQRCPSLSACSSINPCRARCSSATSTTPSPTVMLVRPSSPLGVLWMSHPRQEKFAVLQQRCACAGLTKHASMK